MIEDAVRQAVLALPAPGERVAVFAAQPETYRALAAERAGVEVYPLDGAPDGVRGYATAIVEGLDRLEDPVVELRAIAAAAPGAQIVALVANAAFALTIDAFIAGAAAGGHAFSESDIAPLFAAAGLETRSIAPVTGGAVGNPVLPLDVSTGHVKIRIERADVLARLQIAAYIVVAAAP